ncbi:MAG TPA: hypothetical protein VIB08_04440, partial [Thermoanaerobaculia bacterium]
MKIHARFFSRDAHAAGNVAAAPAHVDPGTRLGDSESPGPLAGVSKAIPAAVLFLVPALALAQGSVSSGDGLTLGLSTAGSVSSLTVGGTNYASS